MYVPLFLLLNIFISDWKKFILVEMVMRNEQEEVDLEVQTPNQSELWPMRLVNLADPEQHTAQRRLW